MQMKIKSLFLEAKVLVKAFIICCKPTPPSKKGTEITQAANVSAEVWENGHPKEANIRYSHTCISDGGLFRYCEFNNFRSGFIFAFFMVHCIYKPQIQEHRDYTFYVVCLTEALKSRI